MAEFDIVIHGGRIIDGTGNPWYRADIAITGFVDIFRTLPQLVVIVFLYFGLPYADIQLSPFAATVLSLGLVLAAFATEIFWSAIQAFEAS